MSNTEDHQEQIVYELGYLVLPSVTEDNIPQVVSNIVSVIEKAGGKPLDSENPFLETLAYSMSKVVGARKYIVDEAYVGWIKFEAEPSVVAEIKSAVEKIDEIVRHLLIKAPRESAFTFAQARANRAALEKEAMKGTSEPEVAAPTQEVAAATAPALGEDVAK
jgi:ribosomal protein S6